MKQNADKQYLPTQKAFLYFASGARIEGTLTFIWDLYKRVWIFNPQSNPLSVSSRLSSPRRYETDEEALEDFKENYGGLL